MVSARIDGDATTQLQPQHTYISDSASNMTTPSDKSDRSAGGFVTEKKTLPKNSHTARVRGSSSDSLMAMVIWDVVD